MGHSLRGRPGNMVDHFVDVAVRLFQEAGFSNVSIEDVSSAAGVTKGAFYYHIASKKELLYFIHDKFISKELNEGRWIYEQDAAPSVKLRMIVRSLVQSIHDYLPYVTVFFNEMRHLEEPYLSQIARKRESYFGLLEAIIRDGLEAGELRDDLDPKITALAIFGICNWMYKWYRPDGPLTPEEIANQYLRLILAGIGTDPFRRVDVNRPPRTPGAGFRSDL